MNEEQEACLDAMVVFHDTNKPQEQLRMLLMMAGCFEDMPAADHADSEAIHSLLCELFLTHEFGKLLHYLRS